MIVGVPGEVKEGENRVALTPDGTRELTSHGHAVLVERGAGEGSAIHDREYRTAGAHIVTGDDAWGADLVIKVKEPQPEELERLRDDLVLFTYLHLAAYPEVAEALLRAGTTALAYETVQLATGALPLLAPMSEVAGRMAPQIGAHYLERENGGRGVLLGGAPGVRPARVVVIGAGNVGWNAAWIAQGMEAEVILLDRDLDRLRFVDQIHKGRIMTLASNRGAVERAVAEADLVIGAVLVAGCRAPTVVTEETVRGMKPGAGVVYLERDRDDLRPPAEGHGFGDDGGLNYGSNFADSSQVPAERGEAEALAASLREALHEVEHALAKIDSGAYGRCESCGKAIAPARL